MPVPDPRCESASAVVVGRVLALGALAIRRRANDVEVAVEVDIDLAAVLANDLNLVGALFVAYLGAGHPAVDMVERDAFGLLDVGPRRKLPSGGFGAWCQNSQPSLWRRRHK